MQRVNKNSIKKELDGESCIFLIIAKHGFYILFKRHQNVTCLTLRAERGIDIR